ncbi:cupin domain-containing protein [Amycolatopsis pithecellobii]|uniref:Cupin domain-containing protein n=1 Tax=Amycolatopsis pithecellobii TaxID=664692 RepID=A0A6N7YI18_9PSEU|nr:cupin domain-containing protein [Amycolatopsis pithecellobii]MTD52547.1 cupin domain-containing protein [Amycolatopsis pithecellobii]
MANHREIPAQVRFPTATELDAEVPGQVITEIADLYTDLDALNLQPLWTQNARLLSKVPRPSALPWLWRHGDLRRMAERSKDLITISRGGDRRVLALANPGLGGKPFATPTLWAAIQYLGGGESAPGHRHSPAAIRFVLEGSGTITTVDGDACEMRSGDLILTPPWQFHDHANESGSPMIWFDGLDLPIVSHLDAIFFELFPGADMQPVRGRNISEGIYGGRATVPRVEGSATGPSSPLLVYRYEDTGKSLAALLAHSAGPMVSLEYINPVTGAGVLPTIGCYAHRIAARRPTVPRREVGSSVFVVYRGSGKSIIDGVEFAWGEGDVFVVPSWACVEHHANVESDLFSITDQPVIKALGLYREDFEAAQKVVGVFEGGNDV